MTGRRIRVAVLFGTRPEAIKMWPVLQALSSRPQQFEPRIIVSAQHRQMLDSMLDLFEIRPHHDLDLMRPDQTLAGLTSRAIAALDEVLRQDKPDVVLVQGDTTTAFVGALAGFYLKIPVGHVEAGLRTHDMANPFPEEGNRRLAGVVATWHFAPTPKARENLLAEGVRDANILVTGNTVIDTLLWMSSRLLPPLTGPLADLDPKHRWILVTAHRRESFGEPMREMFSALGTLATENSDVEVIYPVHMNPHVRTLAREILGHTPRVHLIEPQSYDAFVALMRRSHLILTDSGGVQEEAPSLGKPVLVMRDTTERPEGIEAGTLSLVGTRSASIVAGARRLLNDPEAYRRMATASNPYGDGKAAGRIADFIVERAGVIPS